MKNLLVITALFVLSIGQVAAGEKVDKVLATTESGKVFIDVQSGKVTIKTWDKKEVKVIGELDDDAEGYQFENNENGRVVFKVHMPKQKWSSWKDKGSKLEFWIPAKNGVKFEGVTVDVKVTDVLGGARINTVNGDIEASNLEGRITLGTVNGDIKSQGLKGNINLNSVNGEIDDSGSEGDLEIETVNGDIDTNSKVNELKITNVNGDMDLDLKSIKEIEISTVNGDINLRADLSNIKTLFITSVGGDTDLKLGGDISAEFRIEAHSGGDIENNLSTDKVRKDKYGPGESLRFILGSGKAEVEINTVNGDIRIAK